MLKLAGVKQPDFIEGKQLSNDNSESNDGDTYLVEAKSCQKFGKLTPATFALIHDHYKLIYYHGYNGFDGVYELYDLQEDPEEIKDLSGTHAALLKDLQELLNQKIKAYI
jgi:arylsulfatase A-like enzyme